jgi:hypothetical protein
MYCLPRFQADAFKEKLKDGTINPQKLMDMTSAERRAFFEDIVGKEHAPEVNASFESKIILKDQQRGMINWAKSITGIKPEVRTDILAKVERLDKVLEPEEMDMFLEDLASKRLGVGVTVEEAGKIADMAKAIETAKEKMLPDSTFPTIDDKLTYGYAQTDFLDYIAALKEEAASRSIKEIAQSIYKEPKRATGEFAGFAKSLKASLDDSSLLNQGIPVLASRPTIWKTNAFKSFQDIWNTFGGKEVMRNLRAQIFSEPDAINGTFKKMKLGIGITEEAFPSQLPEKIPYLGRAFRAAENAFTGFQYRNRVDLAKYHLAQMRNAGIDTTDKERLEALGKMINSVTGRGNLGRAESVADIGNKLFFSPRFFKSHYDVLWGQPIMNSTKDAYVRKESAKTLAKMVITLGSILVATAAVAPDHVELDPRSTNFGKIKIFGHWTDITGGNASLITLAARFGTFSSKSASTGQVSALNSGKFGATTVWNALFDFMGNKLSPLAGIFRDIAKGTDPNGNKPTFFNEAGNLLVPIPITAAIDLNKDPNKANVLGALIANTLGLNVSTYTPSPSGIVANDKPAVTQEVFDKLAAGDEQGAKDLAHSFNEELRQSIKNDIAKKNPDVDPNDLETQTDTKWKKNAIYMPTDAEVEKYKAGDKSVVTGVTTNGKPIVKTVEPVDAAGIIGTVVTYAKAIGVDPATAFSDIFKGESIRYVTNGTVVVQRMSLKESTKVKEERGGNNPTMKLDHTLPLQLGGTNDQDNLKLVPTDIWKNYTPVEDYLGNGLRAGRIKKKEAQESIAAFKNGTITFDQIKTKYPVK